jgi:multidrug efflux pump subunit AcrB
LQFDRSVSVDFASQAVQAAINAAAGFLPSMWKWPIVRSVELLDDVRFVPKAAVIKRRMSALGGGLNRSVQHRL